jgi:hypothetical protein
VKVATIKIREFEICGHIWPQSCLLHAKICHILLQQTPFQLLPRQIKACEVINSKTNPLKKNFFTIGEL